MREILFRGKIQETEFQNIPNGWGEQDGDWIEGLYYIRTDCTCHGYEYCECDGFDNYLISDSGKGDYPVIPETIGQFTGLKDKNGKRIFEGDIVQEQHKNSNSKANFIVKYLDHIGRFVGESGGCCIDLRGNDCWTIEVIGNIYDNPELLENTK